MDKTNNSIPTNDTIKSVLNNASTMDNYDWSFEIENGYYINFIERIIALFGTLLNALTIIILLSLDRRLKTQLKLILSLALSDGLIAIFHFISTFYVFPSILKSHRNSFVTVFEQVILNALLAFLYAVSQFAGLGTMCAITVDIFIKVRKPLRYKTLMSKRRGNIIITCLWGIPILLLLSLSVFAVYHSNFFILPFWFTFANVLYCVLCLFFFLICMPIYISIFCSIRSFMLRQPSSYRHSTTRTAVTFLLIMATYFMCILPDIAFVLIIVTNLSHKEIILAIDVARCLYTLNTVLDPIIYATRIPEIQTRYKKLCINMHSWFRRD